MAEIKDRIRSFANQERDRVRLKENVNHWDQELIKEYFQNGGRGVD